MKRFPTIVVAAILLATTTICAFAQRMQQPLGRGVVAVNRTGGRSVTSTGGQGNLISWRRLAQEPEGTTYNVWRRAVGASEFTKMNTKPLTVTNYAPSTLTANTEYAVTAIAPDGTEGPISQPFLYKTQPWPNVWFCFDFDDKVIARNDYRTKFVWPMDLDGNGEYDAVVVDRLFAGAADNDDAENATDNTATTSHKIQAYKLDGTLLWTVDMGPNVNISAGQNDMVVAYDINCDGRCEVMIRASDGTRFWDKANNTWGKYAMGSDKPDVDGDGIVDYRTQSSRNRPFYVCVIDGATGEEIAANELKYSEVHDGSDSYTRTSRPNYMSDNYSAMDGHFAICYLDGVHPSLVMECLDRDKNKTHHNYVFTWDYDWTGGKPTNWHHSATWSRNDKKPWPAEFHQLRVADVNGDGCDEMIQGGYSVNPLKGWFCSPGIAHGDRYILSDIDPERPGLEVFAIQQYAMLGQILYDASTGERLREWYLPSAYDVGRGACMDVDASRKGYEIYSFTDDYIYDCKGNQTNYTRSGCGISTMFEGVWWNGDLQREELSSPGGKGWTTNLMVTQVLNKARLVEFSQESNWQTFAATGTRPAFMGDITGDWREEVILARQNNDGSTGLVGYTTNMPTTYSIYCLQQDPHYRGDCTTRGYYQHPNTSFYLGGEMPEPQLPPCMVTDVVFGPLFGNAAARSATFAASNNAFTDYSRSKNVAYADGMSVLIDLYAPSHIILNEAVKPGVIYAMPVRGQRQFVDGTGSFEGDMDLWKSQQGTFAINVPIKYTGTTYISEGTLEVHSTIPGPVELRARGTLAGNATLAGDLVLEGALNYEGGRLSPGNDAEPIGIITLKKGLNVNKPLFYEANIDGASTDLLAIEGDLNVASKLTIHVKHSAKLEPAGYRLITFSGEFKGKAENISVMGLEGLSYNIKVSDGQVLLVVNNQREAAKDVQWTGAESAIWDYQTHNWLLADAATDFVAGDEVHFTDAASKTSVTLNELMPVGSITVNNEQKAYTFNGTEGGFSGDATFRKEGAGKLTINNTKSTYTGATIITGGTVSVKELADGGKPSSIGAATSAAANWQLGRATLIINNGNAATDRALILTDSATIQVPNGGVNMKGALTGKGSLTKTGSGQLTLSGANSYSGGTVLAAGTLAMGTWNTTFGTSTAPITVTGNATLAIFNNNSTSQVPTFQNRLTINAGKTLTMATGQRCKVLGTLLGSGTMNISYPYVRGDFSMNTANFEGTLNVTSGQFHITAATDLSKATMKLGAGVYAVHTKSQSGDEQNLTTKIGSLQSAAADAQLSTGTWNVGYLGKDDTFAGKFTGTLNKYGTGTLRLTGTSNTGALTVNEGTIGAGTVTSIGTLTHGGLLTVKKGGGLLVKVRRTTTKVTCDAFNVSGKTTLNSPTLLINILSGTLQAGDELPLFTGTGKVSLTGTADITPERPAPGLLWDTSRLASEGILAVIADPDGIGEISSGSESSVSIYDLNGRKLNQPHRGVVIINGKKIRSNNASTIKLRN